MENGSVNSPRQRRARRSVQGFEKLDDLLERGKAEQYAQGRMNGSDSSPDMASEMVMRGVTLNWLSQVFQIEHGKVKALLKDCPIKARHKNGAIYDVKVAAGYLVKPVVDIEAYLQNMKVEELPTRLQDQYWSAMNKRQKWEENAGQLWRTARVAAAFGEVFLYLKEGANLFVQNLQTSTEVTPRQQELLEGMTRTLLKDFFQKIVNLKLRPDTVKAGSMLAEEEAMIAKTMPKKPAPLEIEDDDDDDMSVI